MRKLIVIQHFAAFFINLKKLYTLIGYTQDELNIKKN